MDITDLASLARGIGWVEKRLNAAGKKPKIEEAARLRNRILV